MGATLYTHRNTHRQAVLCREHVRAHLGAGPWTEQPAEEPCGVCAQAGAKRRADVHLEAARGRAHSLVERLLAYETDGDRPRDGRRVVSEERQALQVAAQRAEDAAALARRSDEAERVLGLWT